MKTVKIDEINVLMVSVNSFNIAKIGHNAKEKILAVEFLNDTLYYYYYDYETYLCIPVRLLVQRGRYRK